MKQCKVGVAYQTAGLSQAPLVYLVEEKKLLEGTNVVRKMIGEDLGKGSSER